MSSSFEIDNYFWFISVCKFFCWVTGSFTLHFLLISSFCWMLKKDVFFCCILKCFSQQHVVSGMLQSLPVAAFMSMLKGYRPSSALQAIFPYNMEPLMTVYKTLYELVQLYFYQNVFCMIVVPVPKFRMRKVTRI